MSSRAELAKRSCNGCLCICGRRDVSNSRNRPTPDDEDVFDRSIDSVAISTTDHYSGTRLGEPYGTGPSHAR